MRDMKGGRTSLGRRGDREKRRARSREGGAEDSEEGRAVYFGRAVNEVEGQGQGSGCCFVGIVGRVRG